MRKSNIIINIKWIILIRIIYVIRSYNRDKHYVINIRIIEYEI